MRRAAGHLRGFSMSGNRSNLPGASAPGFSLGEARHVVRDLFAHNESIYWRDFLISIVLGSVAFGITRRLHDAGFEPLWLRLAIQAVTFSIACWGYYRAASFVHEVVHLPDKKMRGFRIAWDLLCGIPFLLPSFTYATHLDHHRRKSYGTDGDGEYLPLVQSPRWWIVLYLSQCIWAPPLAIVRFGLLTPLAWLFPSIRQWVHRHASSLVMDPSYIRPLPSRRAQQIIRLQEVGCFLWIAGVAFVPKLLFDRWPITFVVLAYLISVVLIFLNSLRTLAAHRWQGDGQEVTFVEQFLDTVTIDSASPIERLIHPINLGYHATHHLFPSLPYHNLPTAHRRLMQRLPADSPYRQTVEPSTWSALAQLLRKAGHRQATQSSPAAPLADSGPDSGSFARA
jgi:fatty acid desaturase